MIGKHFSAFFLNRLFITISFWLWCGSSAWLWAIKSNNEIIVPHLPQITSIIPGYLWYRFPFILIIIAVLIPIAIFIFVKPMAVKVGFKVLMVAVFSIFTLVNILWGILIVQMI